MNAAGEADYVRGPAYPLFIAATQLLWPEGGVPAILWMQALVDTLTAALVAGITRRVISPAASLIAVALYAINPLAIYSCVLVGPEILFAFLLTAALAAFIHGIETNRNAEMRYAQWMAIAGCAIGMAVLSRATPVLLVPIWGFWLLLRQVWCSRAATSTELAVPANGGVNEAWTNRLRHGLIGAVILGATSASVVLPWTYRNWVVFHEFIPVVANGGTNFYAGSSERFWPPPPEHHRQLTLRHDELVTLGEIPPGESPDKPSAGDKYQYALGMANYRVAWRDNPFELANYLFRKSFRLWYATQSGRLQWFVGGANAAWMLLATTGLFAAWRTGRSTALVPCLLTVAYFQMVLTAMFPLARYVVGFTPCLCILSGAIILLAKEKSQVKSEAILKPHFLERLRRRTVTSNPSA